MTEEQLACNESWLTRGTVFANQSRTSHEGDEIVKTFGISIAVCDVFIGGFGNFMTILAILRNRKIRNTFHSFIVSLCFVDFCTATFLMPLNAVSYATETWPFGKEHITCAIQAFVYYCCGYSSVVCLLVITANRYVGVLYSEKYEEIFTKKIIFLTIAFSLSFAPIVLGVFFFLGNDGKPGYGWIDKYSLCVFRTDNNSIAIRRYMMFTRILFQFVPLVLMIAAYSKIFYTVWKSGQDVAKLSLNSAEPDNGSTTSFVDKEDERDIQINTGKLRSQSETHLERIKVASLNASPSKEYHSDGSEISDEDHVGLPSILKSSPKCSSCNVSVQFKIGETGNSNHLNQPSSRYNLHTKTLSRNTEMISLSKKKTINDKRFNRELSIRGALLRKKPRFMQPRSSIVNTIRQRQKMDKRLLKISVTICVAFSVIFYPSVIVNLFPCSKYFNPNIHRLASIITWLNPCLNPIIYCFMNPKLRAEYKSLLQSLGNRITRLFVKETETQRWESSLSCFRR